MRKTMLRALITTALLAVMFAVMPVSGIRAEAATKKPEAVKKIDTVKVTKNSIQIKFGKAKNAKGYQVSVYNGKEKVKGMKVKKTSCTVKGLEPNTQYTIKVCGYNGKVNGKMASAKIYTADKNGIVAMGKSTATGKALEKEYNAWRDYVVKEAVKKYESSPSHNFLNSAVSVSGIRGKCTKNITSFNGNPNEYDKKKVYETYKRGKGTNLELYQLILDIANQSGKAECEIIEVNGELRIADWKNGFYLRIGTGFWGGGKCEKK